MGIMTVVLGRRMRSNVSLAIALHYGMKKSAAHPMKVVWLAMSSPRRKLRRGVKFLQSSRQQKSCSSSKYSRTPLTTITYYLKKTEKATYLPFDTHEENMVSNEMCDFHLTQLKQRCIECIITVEECHAIFDQCVAAKACDTPVDITFEVSLKASSGVMGVKEQDPVNQKTTKVY